MGADNATGGFTRHNVYALIVAARNPAAKVLEVMELVIQYAYYAMLSWDKKQGLWSGRFSRSKAIFVLFVVETWMFLVVYLAVGRALGFHAGVHFPLGVILGYVAVMLWLNHRVLRSHERIDYFRSVFSKWDRRKCLRWNVGLVTVAIVVFAVFLFLASGRIN